MVNALRYKILTETTDKAIRRYCKTFYGRPWLSLVEDEVYYQIVLNDPKYVDDFYTDKEVRCMRDLIREGKWVKYRDGELILCRCDKNTAIYSETDSFLDYNNHINGAD
jgi:hypothetical protein